MTHSDNDDTINVMVVDDHPALRAGLAAIIQDQPGMRLLGEASNGAEAISNYQTLRPTVVTLDLRMPGTDGLKVLQELLDFDKEAKVLIMTMFDHEQDVMLSIRSGARGYILKSSARAEIVAAIKAIASGRRWLPEYVAVKLASGMTAEDLTPREQEVLEYIQLGLGNKEIGRQLGMTEGTVKTHVREILGKIGAISRTEAVNLARQRGILK